MSLHQFFLDDQVIADEGDAAFALRLSRDDAKHFRVLRISAGEHIAVVDAARDFFECEVVSTDDELPFVRIAQRLGAPDEGAQVIVVQGLAKGDKMESVIRHGTEIGVAGFVPFACERSVVKVDAKRAASKRERWQAIAKSAAMQSGRRIVPEVADVSDLREVCEALAGATAVLVCWEEAPQTARLSDAIARGRAACFCTEPADARVAVVIGPEGGLTEREVEALLSCSERASLVSLGPSILRTETAGVVAAALAIYELGGLGNVPARSAAKSVSEGDE